MPEDKQLNLASYDAIDSSKAGNFGMMGEWTLTAYNLSYISFYNQLLASFIEFTSNIKIIVKMTEIMCMRIHKQNIIGRHVFYSKRGV